MNFVQNMAQLNSTSKKVLEMIVALQERHHLNQSAIPILNKYILEIISSFAVELEVRKNIENMPHFGIV